MSDLSRIVKAYDVRGIVPDQFNVPVAEALGAAFVAVLRAEGADVSRSPWGMTCVSPRPVSGAFIAGARRAGADVVLVGLASTDMLYYASGLVDLPGAMFTASHNPAQYNGIKLCRAGARPIGQDTGLFDIRDDRAAHPRRAPGPDRRPPDRGARSRSATCSPTTPRTCARWSTCGISGR